MLKIGDFSKLGHVTIKTLRHYAELGLLKPVWIDRFTGYRYYSLEQLPRLNRILALKDLGFSLEEVNQLLNENLTAAQMRSMLAQKQAELAAHVRAEQQRLQMVAARLQQIEQEGQVMHPAVVLKQVPQQAAAVLRTTTNAGQAPQHNLMLFAEIEDWLQRSGIRSLGVRQVLFDNAAYRERGLQLEAAVGVEMGALERRPLPAAPRIALRSIAALPLAASLVYSGQPVDSLQACTSLYTWVEQNGYRLCGAVREVYLQDDSEAQCLVELQVPVEHAALASKSDQGQWEAKMNVRFVDQPAFSVMGMCYHGKNQNGELGVLWGEFNQRAGEIASLRTGPAYGVCSMPSGLSEGEFEYVAGFEVADSAVAPEGMVVRRIPAARHAVFEHRGTVQTLGATYQRIYQTWLPQSGLQPLDAGLDMEVYPDEWLPDDPQALMYIHVPLK